MKRALTRMILAALLATVLCPRLQAHESPVDQVSRTLRLWVEGDRLRLRYEERVSERCALLELLAMDRNRNGIVQDGEQRTFFAAKARQVASRLQARMDGAPLELEVREPVTLRRGWRQVYEFQIPLAAVPGGAHVLRIADRNNQMRPGPFQWMIGRPVDLGERSAAPGRAQLRAQSSAVAAPELAQPDLPELELVLDFEAGK
jgi:hypothetical protein